MDLPFTFGVELEMMVALVCCEAIEDQEKPDPSETRIVFFPPTNEPEDISNNNKRRKSKKTFPAILYANRVKAEFRRIISEAGFPLASDDSDISGWAIVGDCSLRHPPPRTDVCVLIPKHFKVLTNVTTGLHVHIGHGTASFSLRDVAKIMAFTYVFEPQLSSLHPLHRYSHKYGGAMRSTSNLSTNYQFKYGELPSALMAITKILTVTTKFGGERELRQKLSILMMTDFDGKMGNYNFNGVGNLARDSFRPTIEFRQHEGTLDGEQIVQWVRLLVGMLSFVENQQDAPFLRFLTTIVDEEKWDKLGDGKDSEREAMMGSTLADGAFTIIDLLQHMGLTEQADYFRNKVFKHKIPPIRPCVQTRTTSGVDWEYQRRFPGVDENSPEYQEADKSRRLFEKHRITRVASRLAGGDWDFDEEHPMWPPHVADREFTEESDSDT
ncbi:hypothetical protein VTL71DRAFT_14204 [Oculimacula yallundae]|uniref:Uncharacterized protein n=1 Tax=Oculimacula yallundae TaxID=86028 RepID=A0ABR4CHT1_9HELO